jgi:hypothetical protein
VDGAQNLKRERTRMGIESQTRENAIVLNQFIYL